MIKIYYWFLDFFRTRQFGGLRTNECLRAMKEYKRLHLFCEISGTSKKVEPHHIFPVSKFPEKAADPTNFICLTRDLHFNIAHLRSWHSYNPNIKFDALALKDKINNRL